MEDFSEVLRETMAAFHGRDVDVRVIADDEIVAGFYGTLVACSCVDDEGSEMALEFTSIGKPQQAAGGVILREEGFRRADWHEHERRDSNGDFVELDPERNVPLERYLAIEIGEDREVTLCRL
jgi:hypothetical protein